MDRWHYVHVGYALYGALSFVVIIHTKIARSGLMVKSIVSIMLQVSQ